MLLLVVLVITVLICRNCNNTEEGFDTVKEGLKVNIEGYWGDEVDWGTDASVYEVTKLNDYLYFDTKNGNLIEVIGTSATATGKTTITPSMLHVTTRPLTTSTKGINLTLATTNCNQASGSGKECTPASNDNILSTYTSYIYHSKSTITGGSSSKYIVLYIPWGVETYIHVIEQADNSDNSKHISSFRFTSSGTVTYIAINTKLVSLSDSTGSSPDNSVFTNDKPNNINSYNGDIDLVKVARYVYFDVENANTIVYKSNANNSSDDRQYDIYKNNLVKYDKDVDIEACSSPSGTCIDDLAFKCKIIDDPTSASNKKYIVIAMRYKKNTIISVIDRPESGKFQFINVARFNETGLVHGVIVKSDDDDDDDDDDNDNSINYNKNDLSGHLGDYDRNTPYSSRYYSNNGDYILKTQIVPPVCPSCPACPDCSKTPGICTNCGGNGGNGTLQAAGKSLVDATGNVASDAVNATGNVVSGAVNATGNVASGIVDTTGKAVDATGNVVTSAVDATGNVVSSTVDATGNVISGTIGATTDLLKSAGSGIAGLLDSNGNPSNAQSNTQVQSAQNKPVLDPYSYQGQLTNKPTSTYMPITSNFSAFGR